MQFIRNKNAGMGESAEIWEKNRQAHSLVYLKTEKSILPTNII